jgi:hypothetical protein
MADMHRSALTSILEGSEGPHSRLSELSPGLKISPNKGKNNNEYNYRGENKSPGQGRGDGRGGDSSNDEEQPSSSASKRRKEKKVFGKPKNYEDGANWYRDI